MTIPQRFLAVSAMLLAVPMPLAAMVAMPGGGWRAVLLVLSGSLAALLLYWWPLGALLASWQGRTWLKLIAGYVLSIPLCFLTLAALYPAWGNSTFHPFVHGRWAIYLSSTPQFYLMVVIVFYLSTLRTARWTMRVSAAALTAGLLVPVYLAASTHRGWPARQSTRTVIIGARIVDAAANEIVDGQNVYVQDGRIVRMSSGAPSPEWTIVNAQGQYLLPGLIDVHTHLQSPVELPVGFKPVYLMRSMISGYAPQRMAYLDAGVTSVRDLGGAAETSTKMRAEIRQRDILGPRLFTVGRLVTSPHGHPVSTIWTSSIAAQGAILPADERSLIDGLNRNLTDYQPDAVKFIHGTIGRAKEELSPELLTAGVRWAGDHGLISVVHAETPQEIADAILAGATGIEHTAYLGDVRGDVPDSLAALVAARHPFLDPTFGEYETALGLTHIAGDEKQRRLARSYQAVRKLYQAGARIAIGTDAPMSRYGVGLHDELVHFTRAGFTPAEIVSFATANNAAYLGKAAELGRVAQGYRADLILTAANPLEHLDTLRRPVWTMLDGQIVAGQK